METIRVEIKDVNQLVSINGKLTRTPLSVDISDEYEIKRLKVLIKALGLRDYSFRSLKDILNEEQNNKIVNISPISRKSTVQGRRKISNHGTTLNKLMNNE